MIPLEEEITALKDKLRSQDAQLRSYEAAVTPGSINQTQSLDDSSTSLQAEKSSRADLELYTSILNTQRNVLSQDVDRLRAQVTELRQSLDQERRNHSELRDTWRKANEHFLRAQAGHLADLGRFRALLTPEQLTQLKDMPEGQSLDEGDDRILGDLPVIEEAARATSLQSPSVKRAESAGSDCEAEKKSEDTCSAVLELSEEDTSFIEMAPDMDMRYSPDKMPRLSEEQKKALSESSPASIETSPRESCLAPEAPTLPGGCRLVGEKEWALLQSEVRRTRASLGRPCPLCGPLQEQVSKAESQFKESEKERKLQDKALQRQREDLETEGLYRKKAEAQWKTMAEEFEKREQTVRRIVEQAVKQHKEVERWKSNETRKVEEKFSSLAERCMAVQNEIERLQRENDFLVGKHSKHSTELQNEIINLPDTMEVSHLSHY